MQAWLDSLIARGAFGPHPSPDLIYGAAIAIACALVLFLVAVPFASIVTWVERRVWARTQSRRSQRLSAMAGRRLQAYLQGRLGPRRSRRPFVQTGPLSGGACFYSA